MDVLFALYSAHVTTVIMCCLYLQAGEAVTLVAGQLCIYELGEEKLSELWTLHTSRTRHQSTFIRSVLNHKLSLTFLNTAGFGSGGPNGGTSSRAVTATCQA